MAEGTTIALVSDAGVPLISDPGYRLVRAAIDLGVPVRAIPGPSAALAALAASGLPTDAFHFGGFLPHKPHQRLKALEALAEEHATLIFYEAPHRVLEALEAIEQALGPRPVALARELTKIHEEFLRGTPAEFARNWPRAIRSKARSPCWSERPPARRPTTLLCRTPWKR